MKKRTLKGKPCQAQAAGVQRVIDRYPQIPYISLNGDPVEAPRVGLPDEAKKDNSCSMTWAGPEIALPFYIHILCFSTLRAGV